MFSLQGSIVHGSTLNFVLATLVRPVLDSRSTTSVAYTKQLIVFSKVYMAICAKSIEKILLLAYCCVRDRVFL